MKSGAHKVYNFGLVWLHLLRQTSGSRSSVSGDLHSIHYCITTPVSIAFPFSTPTSNRFNQKTILNTWLQILGARKWCGIFRILAAPTVCIASLQPFHYEIFIDLSDSLFSMFITLIRKTKPLCIEKCFHFMANSIISEPFKTIHLFGRFIVQESRNTR